MLGIGIVVGLLGYGLTYWGAQMWSGCTQNTFLDIMWPGGTHFKPCQPSSSGGGSGGGGAPGGNSNPGSPKGSTVPGGNSTGTNPAGVGKYGTTSA